MKCMICLIILAFCLSCGRVPIDSTETLKAELVEQNRTREFGFEIGIPKDLFDVGWRGYSFEMKPPFPDYYRAIQFNRLFVLVIGAHKEGIIPPLTNGNPDALGGLILYVYDRPSAIPSFEKLIDIVKSLEHKVYYWDLNGSVAAELVPLSASGNIGYRKYPHATSYVPRLILSNDRFVYFLSYWQQYDIISRSRNGVNGPNQAIYRSGVGATLASRPSALWNRIAGRVQDPPLPLRGKPTDPGHQPPIRDVS